MKEFPILQSEGLFVRSSIIWQKEQQANGCTNYIILSYDQAVNKLRDRCIDYSDARAQIDRALTDEVEFYKFCKEEGQNERI